MNLNIVATDSFSFFVSLMFGVVALPLLFALLAKTKNKLCRVALDFGAILAMFALFLLSIEIGNHGQLRAFNILAFAIGLFLAKTGFDCFVLWLRSNKHCKRLTELITKLRDRSMPVYKKSICAIKALSSPNIDKTSQKDN